MPETIPSVTTTLDTPGQRRAVRRGGLLTGGGPAGNEQLTSIVGAILIILLAVLGITIIRIGQLIWLHLFLGLLLLGPVALKMASTGYRFARYYTHDRVYREKGRPPPLLRLLAPGVVLTTLGVFVSGVVLLFGGPAHRGSVVLIHKVSFIVWLALTAVHVLGHLPQLPLALKAPELTGQDQRSRNGTAGRWLAISGAVVGGVVLAIVFIPDFSVWTAHGSLFHHHHDH